MRLIVGISGASGVEMGFRMLRWLSGIDYVETHLVMTTSAEKNFELETSVSPEEVKALASYAYDDANLGARIASGSFRTDGMIVVPCSMKSLSGIVNSFDAGLLIRAADVCLKEGRKVVLVPREMPLGNAHIENMLKAKQAGCAIVPPMLTFYNASATLAEQMDHVIGKVLMQFGIDLPAFRPWDGV